MITQLENEALRTRYADFQAQCTAYKSLLTANRLPLSVDLAELTAAYRRQLFDQLLNVDAGLKARFELLRTEEGQQKLIADTVNTDGHEPVEQVGQALQALSTAYKTVSLGSGHGWLHQRTQLVYFARRYALDLFALLDDETLSWKGREHVLAYFEGLVPELTRVRNLFRPFIDNGAGLAETFGVLASFYHEDRTSAAPRVNEQRLHETLLRDLERRDMLGMIPR